MSFFGTVKDKINPTPTADAASATPGAQSLALEDRPYVCDRTD